MTEEEYIRQAVKYAEKKGFSQIKANHEDFEKPSQYSRPNEPIPYIPDVTAVKGDNKSFFEVAIKTDDPMRKISKWKLLNTLAERKGGKLYLLAPKGHKSFVQRIIERYRIQAELIYMA